MIRIAILTSAFALAIGPVAAGAAAPVAATPASGAAAPSAAAGMATMGATFALNRAYRAIGQAEAQNATGRYLDAAKTHYRNALARFGHTDAAAGAEAMAAAALARAAIFDRPRSVPRDVPTPPALAARPEGALDGPPPGGPRFGGGPRSGGGPGGPRSGGGPGGPGGPGSGGPGRGFGGMRGPGGMRAGFDPAAIARYATLANTPEVTELAGRAVDADIARTRAAFAGNMDDAIRDAMLANSLAAAVRSLAYTEHPDAFPRPVRRVFGGGQRSTTDDGSSAQLPPVGMLPPPDDDGGE
jgi:hypothetical protein